MAGTRTETYVFPLTRDIIIGWPSAFNLTGTPDIDFTATQFYINSPAEGFLWLNRFSSLRNDIIEFCGDTCIPLARLPGPRVDPQQVWMRGQFKRTLIAPLVLGPGVTANVKDVCLQVQYTGLVPRGMRAGERMQISAWFIGSE